MSIIHKPRYGKLPKGWEVCTVGDISSLVQFGLSNSAETIGEYRLLRITDIQNNRVRWTDVPFTNIDKTEAESYVLNIGDILFARTGATVGKSFLITELPLVSVFASYLIRVKLLEVNPKYVKYFFESVDYWKQITDKSVGIGQPNVNGTKLKEIILALPPLAEQRRIVSAIESAFAVIDEIEQNKNDLQSAIAATKQKILSLAIRGKLVKQDPNDEPASVLLERIRAEREKLVSEGKIKRGKGDSAIIRSGDNPYYEKIDDKIVCIDSQIPFDIPESWEWYRLSSLWNLLSGRDLTPSEYTDSEIGIPYITGASNFTDSSLIINRWTTCPTVIARDGDLLITCKGTVGAMRINNQGEIHIARQIMAIRNREGLNIEFLRIVLSSFILQITSAARGVIPGISREDLLNILIPCPPLREQAHIVKAVSEAEIALNEIIESLN